MTETVSDAIQMVGTAIKTVYDQEVETSYYPDTGQESVTTEDDSASVCGVEELAD